MCGPLNSKKNDGSLLDKVNHGLKETYEDLSKVKNADESLYDKFKHGVEAAYKDVNKIKGAIDDEVESTFEKAGLGVPYHFIKGGREALGDEIEGLLDSAIHPIDSINNTIEAVSHLDETFNAIKQTISDSWNTNVVNGDWNSRAELYGSIMSHGMFALLGAKGVDKIAMLKPGTTLAEVSRNAKQSLQDAASLFKGNRSQLAFADGSGGLSRINIPEFKQAKDTFLFFDKFKSHPNSIYKNNGTVEHIFHGNLNKAGAAGGYHHKSMMAEGEILRVTRSPNRYGVYEAEVSVNGVPKTLPSTFFPDHWGRTEVLKAIEVAYNNKVYSGRGNRYIGTAPNGMKIRLFIDSNGRIISAFPLY
ncbi:hypothetical protein BAPA111461_17245 [Bacillus paramycoides]